MRLVFEDVETNEVIVNIAVTQTTDGFVVDFDSSVYKTYDFMIDCALYCLENDMTTGSYDDDNDKPLANWALLDDCAFAYSTPDGFHVDFYDGDVVTHDEHFDSWKEVLSACETYIAAGLFDRDMFANTWENSSYNSKNFPKSVS